MLSLALTLALFAAQPDDGPVATQQVIPPPSAAALEEVRRKEAEQRRKDEEAAKANKIDWDWHPTPPAPPPPPPTEEEKRAAANRAAMERAEAAGRDANAPPGAWPDDGKMRCKPTENGIVCGNSDEALGPDSPARKALDEMMKPN